MKYLFYAIIFDVAGNITPIGSSASPTKTFVTNIQKVTGINISPSDSVTKNIGENFTITATVSPSDANNKSINWSSSSTSIATVDNGGNVRCLATGTTTISATAADGSGKSASLELTVKIPLTDIILDKSTVGLVINGSTTITATTTPSDVNSNLLNWTTSDSSVAEISVNGKTVTITGKKAGTATITVTGGSIARTVTISVVSADITTINASKTFDYTGTVQELKVAPGQKYKLEVWGAQGYTHPSGYNNKEYIGGKGGYLAGTYVIPDKITKLYIVVGGSASNNGYNGGRWRNDKIFRWWCNTHSYNKWFVKKSI